VRTEGLRLLDAAINRGWKPNILTTEEYFEKIDKKHQKKIFVSEKEIIKKHMLLPKLEPIIGTGNYPARKKISYKKNIVILFSQDPTNIGSIIRTSRGHDINDFIFAKEAPDPYNLLVLRSSAGSSFGINYCRINDKNLEMLCDHEILTAVAHNGANIKTIKIKKSKNAFVFGHESKGVPERWLKESKKVTIKTKNIESLSVSSAAAIIINQILD
tara:strand:- start:407 stop:1051 length:645 start_codon:yes stop_codon:yes gene_type:complete